MEVDRRKLSGISLRFIIIQLNVEFITYRVTNVSTLTLRSHAKADKGKVPEPSAVDLATIRCFQHRKVLTN